MISLMRVFFSESLVYIDQFPILFAVGGSCGAFPIRWRGYCPGWLSSSVLKAIDQAEILVEGHLGLEVDGLTRDSSGK